MNVTHAAIASSSSIKFCTCNQGFSGANAQARLDAHVANPDPNSTGAMLIALMGSK